MTDILKRISDYASANAARNPNGEALVLGTRRWTHQDVAASVDILAKALLAHGITKGDRIAVLQTPHPDYWITFLATASIGAIWVGLNPRYRLAELTHVIADAEPALLIARSRIDDRDYSVELTQLTLTSKAPPVIFDGDPVIPGAISMSEFLSTGADVSRHALEAARKDCGGRDPCLIVYTSGSTGKPKGALLHHEGIATFCVTQNSLWTVAPIRTLNFLPINHIGCVVDISAPAMVGGGTIVFLEQFHPQRSMALIESEQLTVWGSVPSVFSMQLALPNFDKLDLSSLQLIVWGGAAMGEDLVRRLVDIHPRVATNYGMTETSSAVTSLGPTNDVAALWQTVGKAFPGVEIKLVDSEGSVVAEGEPGEVLTRSRLNFLGYWRQSDATAAAFDAEGYFRTGDIAVQHSDGRYTIVGRVKEMFKSGGYNVYPREVETVLECHPNIKMAAVVGVPDQQWQEVGVAYVVAEDDITVEGLEAWCRARLANYKVPKRFVLENELPLLPIGKIDKLALKRKATA